MGDVQINKSTWCVQHDQDSLWFRTCYVSTALGDVTLNEADLFPAVQKSLSRMKIPPGGIAHIIGDKLFDYDWETNFPDTIIARCEHKNVHAKHARRPLRGKLSYRRESRLQIVYCRSSQFSLADETSIADLVYASTARVVVKQPRFCSSARDILTIISSSCADHLAIVGHFDGDGLLVGSDVINPGAISDSLPRSSYLNSLLLMACSSGASSGAQRAQRSFAEIELAVGAAPVVVGLVDEANTTQIADVLKRWINGLNDAGGSILSAFRNARAACPLRLFLREVPTKLMETRIEGTTHEDHFRSLCVAVAEAVVEDTERLPLAMSDLDVNENQTNSYEVEDALEPILVDGEQRSKVLADLVKDIIDDPKRRLLMGMRLSGKSTVATLVCREIAHRVLQDPRLIDRLVLQVRLRDIEQSDSHSASSLQEQLVRIAARRARSDYELLNEITKTHSDKIILVLDGWDEIEDKCRIGIVDVLKMLPWLRASVLVVGRSEVGDMNSREHSQLTAGRHEIFNLRSYPVDDICKFADVFASRLGKETRAAIDRLKAAPDQWLLENLGMLTLWLAEVARGSAVAPPNPAGIARAVVEARLLRLGGTSSDAAILSNLCALMRERGVYQISFNVLLEHYRSLIKPDTTQISDLNDELRTLLLRSGVFWVSRFRTGDVTADIRFCELLAASTLTEPQNHNRLINLISESDLDGLVKRADLLSECIRASYNPGEIVGSVLTSLGRLDNLESPKRHRVLSLLGMMLRATMWKRDGGELARHQKRLGEVTFTLLCQHVRELGWFEAVIASEVDPVLESVAQAIWSSNPTIGESEAQDVILGLLKAPLEHPQPRSHPFARFAKPDAQPGSSPSLPVMSLRRLRGPLWLALGLALSYVMLWQNLYPLLPAVSESDRGQSEIVSLLLVGSLMILLATRFTLHKMIPDVRVERAASSRITPTTNTFGTDQACSDGIVRLIGPLLLNANTLRRKEFLEIFAARLDLWRGHSDDDLAASSPESLAAVFESPGSVSIWKICDAIPQAGQDEHVYAAVLRSLRWCSAIGEPGSRRTLPASIALFRMAPFILASQPTGEPSWFLKRISEWGLSDDALKARAAAVALETTSRWFSIPGSDDPVALATMIRLINDMIRNQHDLDVQRSLFFAAEELALARSNDIDNPFADVGQVHVRGPRPYEGQLLARIRNAIDANKPADYFTILIGTATNTVYAHGLRIGWLHRPHWLASASGCMIIASILKLRHDLDYVGEEAIDVIDNIIRCYQDGQANIREAGLIPILANLASEGTSGRVNKKPLLTLISLGDAVRDEPSVLQLLQKSTRYPHPDAKVELLGQLCLASQGVSWTVFKQKHYRLDAAPEPRALRMLRSCYHHYVYIQRLISRFNRKLW
ncbi:MAG: hypothetical protein KIT24_11580 [Phycisphaeraceae bacterium]|nr:hypothetical protein [Phycisphaeraceae bacterium]